VTELAQTTEKVWIQPITDERLAELSETIKPIIRFAESETGLSRSVNGLPYHIEPVDLRYTAFTWDPKPTIQSENLKELCDITTYHSFSFHGFFKPSIAEVIAAIPDEQISAVVAFEIISSPETPDDLNNESEALNAGYHVARTRLYTRN
jgi:protoheme ferro-lyase